MLYRVFSKLNEGSNEVTLVAEFPTIDEAMAISVLDPESHVEAFDGGASAIIEPDAVNQP